MKLGRHREAMQEIEQALKVKSEEMDVKSMMRRVQIMMGLSEFERAESEAGEMMKKMEESGEEGWLEVSNKLEFKDQV